MSTMNPPGAAAALKDALNCPLYFFDQPLKHVERTRSILYFILTNERSQSGDGGLQKGKREDGSEDRGARSAGGPDTSAAAVLELQELWGVYKREAPELLKELSFFLSQHEGEFPQGIVNILDCSWEDLTAGALVRRSSALPLKPAEHRRAHLALTAAPVKNAPFHSDIVRKYIFIQEPPKRANFSLLQKSKIQTGWIVQPLSDEPDWMRLCRRVMQLVQVTRKARNILTIDDYLKEHISCHYYEEKVEMQERNEGKTGEQGAPGCSMTLRSSLQYPLMQQKFHYEFKDGSSFILYPSGRMAVCQSCSGLRCGGFYTNVFADIECPLILATVTPFGHGSVTHLSNGNISAMWDQAGGFKWDQHGVVTKEWRWLTGLTQIEKVDIQVCEQISVRLLSGTSAKICFRWKKRRADLLLPVVSSPLQPETRPNVLFSSDAARDLTPKRRSTSVEPKPKKEVLQEFKETEELEQLEERRQGGHAGRKVKMLQKRVRHILEDWMDYYRRATGIKCPNLIRMPDSQLRNQVRRAVQSADLSSLCPSEHFDIKSIQSREDKGPSRLEITPGSPPLQSSAVPLLFKFSPSCLACPVLLRAALREEGGRRRCCCSTTAMPVVTDLEYDALIMGQPPQSHQILVVCVTPPDQPVSTASEFDLDVLDQLYRRMNLHRTAPCTQCQLDSFRLLRYEMPTGLVTCCLGNFLLHRRHHAAPGMFLMYIRGKLLFLGFIFSADSRTEKDFLKEISRVRGDYRLGLSLPSDYKYSGTVNISADADSTRTKKTAPDSKVPEVTKQTPTNTALSSESKTSLDPSCLQGAESQADFSFRALD